MVTRCTRPTSRRSGTRAGSRVWAARRGQRRQRPRDQGAADRYEQAAASVQRARAFGDSLKSAQGREADASASRPTPLTLVAGAVAGDSLDSVAAIVAASLSCPVAIAIPALGEPVVEPPGALAAGAAEALVAYAAGVIAADEGAVPDLVADAVAVHIAEQIVGIVAAVTIVEPDGSPAPTVTAGERRAWLRAGAAGAAGHGLVPGGHAAQ